MPLLKESLITIRHLLSMSTGIDESKQLVVKNNTSLMLPMQVPGGLMEMFFKSFSMWWLKQAATGLKPILSSV